MFLGPQLQTYINMKVHGSIEASKQKEQEQLFRQPSVIDGVSYA